MANNYLGQIFRAVPAIVGPGDPITLTIQSGSASFLTNTVTIAVLQNPSSVAVSAGTVSGTISYPMSYQMVNNTTIICTIPPVATSPTSYGIPSAPYIVIIGAGFDIGYSNIIQVVPQVQSLSFAVSNIPALSVIVSFFSKLSLTFARLLNQIIAGLGNLLGKLFGGGGGTGSVPGGSSTDEGLGQTEPANPRLVFLVAGESGAPIGDLKKAYEKHGFKVILGSSSGFPGTPQKWDDVYKQIKDESGNYEVVGFQFIGHFGLKVGPKDSQENRDTTTHDAISEALQKKFQEARLFGIFDACFQGRDPTSALVKFPEGAKRINAGAHGLVFTSTTIQESEVSAYTKEFAKVLMSVNKDSKRGELQSILDSVHNAASIEAQKHDPFSDPATPPDFLNVCIRGGQDPGRKPY